MRLTKVMQVVYTLEPGGSENLSRDIILGLDQDTFNSSICALAGGGALEGELKKERVPCYVMNRRSGFDKSLPWRLYQVFRRDRVDIVQTHHLGQLLYSVFGARMVGARLIHVEHECYTLQSHKAQRRLRWLSRWCDTVVGVSEAVSDFLRKEVGIPSNKVVTILNGVDCQRFAPRYFSTRDEAGFSAKDVLIGTVARLEPEKDLFVLLDAFHRVRRLCSNAKLVIVGDGSLKGSLEQRTSHLGLEKDVLFLGWRSDIPAVLGLFDIFVLSSFEEGLPLVILEAMAAAKPVVATAVGSIPDVVTSDTGFVVPRRDAEGLAGALQTLVLDPALRQTLGRAGRILVESRYNLHDTVKGYQRLYETMV
jgi:sugar transferase (PEP-CTERM/EpsH1 system associated)